MNLEGPVIQQIRNYSALEVDNNKVKYVEPSMGARDKGKQKEVGIRFNEPAKIVQIHDSMSPSDIELEKRRKEKVALAKKLEIAENEVAIVEMNNKIKFLENSRKQFVVMPEDNVKIDQMMQIKILLRYLFLSYLLFHRNQI